MSAKRPTSRRTRRSTSSRPKRAVQQAPEPTGYVLRLYVTGASPRSAKAIANIRSLCEEQGADLFVLEVIDIYQQPDLARAAQLVASPTLLKTLPRPERRLVGDLSDHARVLRGLGIAGREG